MTTGTSSSSSFTLSYDGPGMAEHSISVRQLGPSLVAVGALFDRASLVVYGDGATVDLKVTSTRAGCFEIELVFQMVGIGPTLLAFPIITSASNIRQLVVSTITWLKHLNRSNAHQAERSDDEIVEEMESISLRVGDIEFESTASGETSRFALQKVTELARDRLILEHLGGVFEPVSHDGIDRVDFKEANDVLETIAEEDLPSFVSFPGDGNTMDFIIPRQMLKVLNPYLGQKTGQWRLHDGERTNRFDMKDSTFANDVRNSVINFSAEDVLECQVRQIQTIDRNGNIKVTREILRVLGHHRRDNGDTQLRIPDV